MAKVQGVGNFEFIVTTTAGLPNDKATKFAIRRKAMKAGAVTKKRNGIVSVNRLQYPLDIYPGGQTDGQFWVNDRDGPKLNADEGKSFDKSKSIAYQFQTNYLIATDQADAASPSKYAFTPQEELMAKLALSQKLPPKLSDKGFSLLSMKYGLSPMNLSALTTLHIGQTTQHAFGIRPSELAAIFRLQQHSYLSFLPSHSNEAQCLHDVTDCLFAVARQLSSEGSDTAFWSRTSASSYGRALRSLHDAINSDASRLSTETLCATQMMSMVELLNASPDQIRFLHIEAASRLILQRGPRGFQSEFEKAILNAHTRDLIIISLLKGRACFLEEEDWQNALLATVDPSLGAAGRSEAVVSLWLCHVQIPGLFKAVDEGLTGHCSNHAREQNAVICRIKRLRHELSQWRSKWSSRLESDDNVLQTSAGSLIPEEAESRRVLVGMFTSCVILANRLYSSLDTLDGAAVELQTQEMATHLLQLHSAARLHSPHTDLFMAQAMSVARAALRTADEWRERLQGSAETSGTSREALFRHWSATLGRKRRR